jgi:hypothetical protein
MSRDAVHWNASINVEKFDDLQPLQPKTKAQWEWIWLLRR